MRADGRNWDKERKIEYITGYLKYADGSCLVKLGNSQVLCSATVEKRVPPFLVGSGQGWVTAEYGMLPCSTKERQVRESRLGRPDSRSQEISRFLGRSLRAIVDLVALREYQIIIDCDCLQADGGTRTAAFNGGLIALYQATRALLEKKIIDRDPIIELAGAISVGIVNSRILLDLTYEEDSQAEVDMNLVLTESERIIEIQATAEKIPFRYETFQRMFELAKSGIKRIIEETRNTIKSLP
jgi:ribonuclease PH|uniref:Ribonuclease PH n=1 Tax=candidate division WOR-3 bacterium TaxID=2052148 RepID=A0A7C3UVH0_UNCW3